MTKARPIPYEQRIGEKHNMLTILEITGKEKSGRHTKIRCLVECECGNRKDVRIEGVVNKRQYSCGCTRKIFKSPYRKAYTGYRNGASNRGYYFNLTQEEFESIIVQDCHYCKTPLANGIDRKDNNLGYDVNNALPCCTICNRAKMDMEYDDFMAWIERLRTWNPNQ